MHGPTGYRSGVGIVLLNKHGMVFTGHRHDGRRPPWQMPQGGLLAGEAPEQAALRELAEEVGTSKVDIIDSCPSWLRYDYPKGSSTPRARLFRGQEHKWFLMRFTGHDSDINIATAHPEFSDWRWLRPNDVVERVVPFKRDVYRNIMDVFTPTIGRILEIDPQG